MVINAEVTRKQKEKTFSDQFVTFYIPFIIKKSMMKTVSNKFMELHKIDKVKFIFMDKIELNGAEFFWKFVLQFLPVFLLKIRLKDTFSCQWRTNFGTEDLNHSHYNRFPKIVAILPKCGTDLWQPSYSNLGNLGNLGKL